ncbi:hypothetical protein CVP05_08260 [Conservatibacter flavescens]|uniref:Porin n=1 Tax=Conservatibacter flavescens TaxID=28161 RepID=A0A2M8S1N1_9PAST|nr:hypothetical protein CVP05_08260 [Conservatibacter flavescens]
MIRPLFCGLLFSSLSFSIQAETTEPVEKKLWVDEQHGSIRSTLHSWANSIDSWFDETDPNNPATASIRVMLDNQWNRYDGYSIKPRVRGKLRLPALKRRFSLVFGDESLDTEITETHLDNNYTDKPKDKHYNRTQARNDNSSLALRWSTLPDDLGVDLDFDIGIRSGDDLYLRAKGEKIWALQDDYSVRAEAIYRYGIDSKHYVRGNVELKHDDTETTFTANSIYLQYTNDLKKEETVWGNSLYRQHNFTGNKRLNYGLFAGGYFKDKEGSLNTYGPFISYRQPILRQWLFIQPELSYYNDKREDRSHYLRAFLRIEAIF